MEELPFNLVEPPRVFQQQSEWTAAWSPYWYDCDQNIAVGESREYRFFHDVPEYVLLNLTYFGLPCPELVFERGLHDPRRRLFLLSCEILEIRNGYWGSIRCIQSGGLRFDMTLESGRVVTVDTEEQPGAIWNDEQKTWNRDTQQYFLPEGSNIYELRFDWNMSVKLRVLDNDPRKLFAVNPYPKPFCTTECDSEESAQRLLNAAQAGDTEAVQRCLSDGENVDAQNGFGDTALFRAARMNRLEIVDRLLHQGASANLSNRRGLAPIHTAAVQGHLEIVRRLLESGAYVDIRNKNGWTPLFLAAGSGHLEVVKCLLQAGANVYAEDGRELTALDNAQKHGYQEIAGILKAAMEL